MKPKNNPNNKLILDRVKTNLQALKLTTILSSLDDQLSISSKEDLPPIQLLDKLLAMEVENMINKRMHRRTKESKLPLGEFKLLSDFDFDFQTGINKPQIMELATLSFIERKQGLILAGGSGTGKSHIAKAILLIACQHQYRCRYTTASGMLKDLISGLSDDTVDKKLTNYLNPDVLLIDEIGFDRLEQESARNASLFFKVINGRYCKNSTIITSNIDFSALGDYLGDPVITTAIVDRMIHHSIVIDIVGPSWRMHESEKINTALTKKTSKNVKKK